MASSNVYIDEENGVVYKHFNDLFDAQKEYFITHALYHIGRERGISFLKHKFHNGKVGDGKLVSEKLYSGAVVATIEMPLGADIIRNEFTIRDIGTLLRKLLFMHSLNIWHLDVKPENIVRYNGELTYIDFGATISINEEHNEILSTRKNNFTRDIDWR